MPSSTLLAFLFIGGALASGAVVWLRGRSVTGTIAKGTGVAFVLLAVVAVVL